MPKQKNYNDVRAKWADTAVIAFRKEVGGELQDVLCDLLCDLMHWADRNDQDFLTQLDRGRWHYKEELKEEAHATKR